MNLALNNASNIFEHYRTKGEFVEVDIVTNGPGLHMLRILAGPGPYPAAKRPCVSGKIQFSACNNTKQAMEKRRAEPILSSRGTPCSVRRRHVDGTAGRGLELRSAVTDR